MEKKQKHLKKQKFFPSYCVLRVISCSEFTKLNKPNLFYFLQGVYCGMEYQREFDEKKGINIPDPFEQIFHELTRKEKILINREIKKNWKTKESYFKLK